MPRQRYCTAGIRTAFAPLVGLVLCVAGVSSTGFAQRAGLPARRPAKGTALGGMQLPPEFKPKPPQSLEQRFADRNHRAIQAFQYSRCMLTTIMAGRSGKLGPVPANDLAVCVRQKNEWRGVFGQFDESSAGFAVRLQYSMTANGTIVNSPVDTAVVAGAARALVRASSIPFPGKPSDEFLPVVLPQSNFYEIWFLSAQMDPTHAIIGGDSLVQLSANGAKELGHSKSTPMVRAIQITPGQSYIIQSSETDVPTVSELIVGNAAADIVPQLTIRTIKWDWVRSHSTPGWRHVPHTL